MSNEFYNASGTPSTGSAGASAAVRSEYAAIAAGFNKMPALAGNAGTAVIVNPGGTALGNTVGSLALAGNFTLSGSFNLTLTQTASVNLTLPATNDTLVGRATTDTLTNKTIDGGSNTLSNIANGSLAHSSISIGSASISLGGTLTLGAGLSITGGNLTAAVVSVAGRTGAVTLSTSDVSGLGTAAAANLGTSGATVPLLSTANTFGAGQAISGSGAVGWTATSSTASGGTAAFEAINDVNNTTEIVQFGSTTSSTTFGLANANLGTLLATNKLAIGTSASGGNMAMGTNATAQLLFTSGGGLSYPGVTGGDKGANTFNVGTLYQAGTALGTAAFANTSALFQIANNLSEGNAASMRSSLALGSAALLASSAVCQTANNGSDFANIATTKTNLGFKAVDINLGDVNATSSSVVSGNHTLGGMPKGAVAFVKNISGGTLNGYSNGAYVAISMGGTSRNDGVSLSMNATQVALTIGANGPLIMDAGTFNGALIGGGGTSRWEYHVLAFIW